MNEEEDEEERARRDAEELQHSIDRIWCWIILAIGPAALLLAECSHRAAL